MLPPPHKAKAHKPMSDTAQIMLRAYKAHVALPAFNIPYLPMMEPVTKAIADEDSFALIEVARLEFIKFEAVSQAAVKAEFDKWQNPGHMRLHQDHVPVIDEDGLHIDYPAELQSAIDLGFGSVMVDGSRLSLDANIAATRQSAEIAHRGGVPCEAELGAVMGHEAGPMPPYEELFASGKGFTDVAEAKRFVQESRLRLALRRVRQRPRRHRGGAEGSSQAQGPARPGSHRGVGRGHRHPAGAPRRLRHPAGVRPGRGQARRRQDQRRHRDPPALRGRSCARPATSPRPRKSCISAPAG